MVRGREREKSSVLDGTRGQGREAVKSDAGWRAVPGSFEPRKDDFLLYWDLNSVPTLEATPPAFLCDGFFQVYNPVVFSIFQSCTSITTINLRIFSSLQQETPFPTTLSDEWPYVETRWKAL
jgi:hypothetical protein